MSGYDVVVVGGRVAGASTAMLLARAGARVVLLDRGQYGSDTLSTHALMRAGVLQLSRWGLLDAVVAAGTPAVRRTDFHYGDGETVQVSVRPSPGVDALYAPRRHVLDRIIVDAAVAAGVEVRHGVSVTGLVRDSAGRVTGVQAHSRSGASSQVHGRIVVGADGIRSVVADAAGAQVERQGRHASGVLYGYYADLPSVGYEWAYRNQSGTGMITTNDGLTCVFVGTTPERLRSLRRQGAEGAFRELFAISAPDQLERLTASTAVGPLHGWSGLPGHVRRAWGTGWALVGDAGYYKDPISAHGMTDALRDAELLTGALLATWSGRVPEEHALAGYQTRRDSLSLRLFEASDRIAAYDWDKPRVQQLGREVSAAMADELELIQTLPDHRVGVRPNGADRLVTGALEAIIPPDTVLARG